MPDEFGGKWFDCLRSNPNARFCLFCFPHAGGGTSLYRSWVDGLPDVEISALVLPGRERRFTERPIQRIGPLVRALASASYGPKPFAFFGHSMGAIVAFELARELRRRGMRQPFHLFVSAHEPPWLMKHRDAPRHLLPDPELIEELRKLSGTDEELFADPSFLEPFLPALRADFELLETYSYSPEDPLSCPITAIGGEQDPEVDNHHLVAWRQQSSSDFGCYIYPGGHFYLRDSERSVVERVRSRLMAFEPPAALKEVTAHN